MTVQKKEDTTILLIIGLLAINLLLSVYIGFFKKDALWLETLKAGWAENMTMAQQLYTSPLYIQQQKSTLNEILGSMNQPAPLPEQLASTGQTEVQAPVTE